MHKKIVLETDFQNYFGDPGILIYKYYCYYLEQFNKAQIYEKYKQVLEYINQIQHNYTNFKFVCGKIRGQNQIAMHSAISIITLPWINKSCEYSLAQPDYGIHIFPAYYTYTTTRKGVSDKEKHMPSKN